MVTFRKKLYKRSGLDHFHAYATKTEKPVLFVHLIAGLKIVLSLRIVSMRLRINYYFSYVTLLTYIVFYIFQINPETCQTHVCNHP